MKKTGIILLAILLSAGSIFSQQLDKFTSLRCGGKLPDDFTTLSSRKYEEDIRVNKDNDLDKNFFISTRFIFDELLLSGQILFNEPVSNYLNKVARYALRGENTLQNELRFYILRSNIANAYSTDQGVILFTTGLLAQLESEAQLAYILCHEISHYTQKHVRSEYVETAKISNGNGQYRNTKYRNRLELISNYSKDLELDADEKGIEMYLNTEYNVDEIFTGFEVLHYSYLPFDDISFDTNFFSSNTMKVPGSLFPDSINQITQELDYDDDGHSHPNIQSRIDAGLDYLGDRTSKGDKKFVVSEDDFFNVRDLCRFESINIALAERSYGSALYMVYLLKRQYTDNKFLDLSLVKCLYGLTKYKNHARYSEVTVKPSTIEGESYTLHQFLKNLSKPQLNVISFRNIYDIAKKYPDDKIFQEYLTDMKKELATNSGIKPNDFSERSFDEHLQYSQTITEQFDIEDSIRKIDESDLSKYEKIRLKKKLNDLNNLSETDATSAEFHLFALHDLVKEHGLINELKTIIKTEEEKVQAQKEAMLLEQKSALTKKPKHLGIDKLVVVNPMYENYKLNEKQNHFKSEDKKISVSEMYTSEYNGLDLETQLVDSKNLTADDVDEYNDLGLLLRWISEVSEHDEIDMISSCHDQMSILQEKYGTSHFLFSGIYAYKERTEMTGVHWYGIMFIYTIPIVIIDLLIVHNYFDILALSINSETDDVEFEQVTSVNLKGIDGILKAYIYDVLYQLSSDPKNKK